jgi:tetratricopeptide (TPR) repeat protein
MNMIKMLLLMLTLSAVSASVLANSSGSSDRPSPYAAFQKLIDDGFFQQAINNMETALKEEPDDADLLNLIAFSHRNLKRYEIALEYYQKALKIEPDHLGANEYLGELYLQMGQLDKAVERLKILDDECFFGCEEFDDLEQAIESYKQKNS